MRKTIRSLCTCFTTFAMTGVLLLGYEGCGEKLIFQVSFDANGGEGSIPIDQSIVQGGHATEP